MPRRTCPSPQIPLQPKVGIACSRNRCIVTFWLGSNVTALVEIIPFHELRPPHSQCRCLCTPDAPQRLLLALIDLWLDRFDAIGALPARKLSALALCTLLPAPLPILPRLELFVAHITSVWFEVEGSGPEAASALDFFTNVAPRDDDIHAAVNCEEAEGEAARRKALAAVDPVRQASVSAVCRGKMEEAAAVHGAGAVNSAAAGLDPTLAAQFQAMLAFNAS